MAINLSRPFQAKFNTYAMVATYLKLNRFGYSECNQFPIIERVERHRVEVWLMVLILEY